MRISDRYIGRQVVTATLFAIIVLSVILVLGSLFRQIRPLLVNQQVPPMLLAQFVLNSLPFSMMYTIPWGFLSAILLVFGRLSSDQELTGFRVAGISLPRLAAPVFVLATIFSGICLWMNLDVSPKAKVSVDSMIYREVMKNPRALLDPGAVQSRFKNQKVFVEAQEGNDGALLGFHMYQTRKANDPNAAPPAYVHAGRVELKVDKEKKNFRLTLDDTFIESPKADGPPDMALAGDAKYWFLDFADSQQRKTRPSMMINDEIRSYVASKPDLHPKIRLSFVSEITKRYSYSMACLAFAFVGVPLALKSRRRDTSSGLLLSMLIGAAYFLSSFVAEQIKNETLVDIALWMPNIVCVVLGLILFRRARFR